MSTYDVDRDTRKRITLLASELNCTEAEIIKRAVMVLVQARQAGKQIESSRRQYDPPGGVD